MRRLNLELSDEAYEQLESLRKRMKKSRAEVIHSAVILLELYMEAKSQGKELAIISDGKIEKIIEVA